jgi:hypothetical protein
MARKDLTTFLIALNDSVKLRDRWRSPDPDEREKLLKQWGLEDEPALQDGGDVDMMREKVDAESGLKQVDLWIRATEAPVSNPEYDPIA